MEALLKTGLKLWRRFAGQDTRLERVLRWYYKTARSRIFKEVVGGNYVFFWARSRAGKRVGIYIKGTCHLQVVFACKEMIQKTLNGTCCIFQDGEIAGSRSDFILQTLNHTPREFLDQIVEKLKMPEDYFLPKVFERTFSVPDLRQEFSKSVVFFNIGPDVVRNIYRHRETGMLVDPGGWWLNQPMQQVLGDLSSVGWFRENFESVGRMEVQAFASNYGKMIDLVRKHTGAHVVVFNVPTVEPGKLVHNYQFVRDPLVKRTREFNVALAELSRKLDFPIVDVDRIMKKAGVGAQKDFAHFSPELTPVIAREAFAVMSDLRVF